MVCPDGRQAVVGSSAGVELRSWPELKLLQRLPFDLPHVHDLAFSPNGRTLAAAGGAPGESGQAAFLPWPLVENAKPRIHRLADDVLYKLQPSPDGRRWAAGSGDGRVVVFQPDSDPNAPGETAEPITLHDHAGAVLGIAWMSELELLTAGVDQTLRLYDASTGRSVRSLSQHTGPVVDLALRPGEHPRPFVLSASHDRTARLWQPGIGRLVRFARLPDRPTSAAWLFNGDLLAVGSFHGRVRFITPDDVQILADIPLAVGCIHVLAPSPDGRSLLVGAENGQVLRCPLPRLP